MVLIIIGIVLIYFAFRVKKHLGPSKNDWGYTKPVHPKITINKYYSENHNHLHISKKDLKNVLGKKCD